MSIAEEARAAQYRANVAARERARRNREKAMAGNVTRRRALADAWEPVVLWLRERREQV